MESRYPARQLRGLTVANIQVISNFDQPAADEPGGGNNLGAVEWLPSVFYHFTDGIDATNTTYSRFAWKPLNLGERILWTHNFLNPSAQATFNQVAYGITSNTSQGAALETQTLAVMAPQTMSFGEGDGNAAIWNSSKGTKLLIAAGNQTAGTSPVSLVSIGLNDQFIESSISKAQTIAATGVSSSSNSWDNGMRVSVSPNGEQIIMRLAVNDTGTTYQLFKANFDADHYLTGLTKLASPISPATSQNLADIIAVSNTHIYTKRTVNSYKVYLDKRDIATGIVSSSITHPDWDYPQLIGPSSLQVGKIFGNSLYVISNSAGSGSTSDVREARIWKINLSTDQVVKHWNVSAPPVDPNFSTGDPFTEPNTYGWANLQSMDIDDSGIVYLLYAADYKQTGVASWSSSTKFYTRRLHRARLT